MSSVWFALWMTGGAFVLAMVMMLLFARWPRAYYVLSRGLHGKPEAVARAERDSAAAEEMGVERYARSERRIAWKASVHTALMVGVLALLVHVGTGILGLR